MMNKLQLMLINVLIRPFF